MRRSGDAVGCNSSYITPLHCVMLCTLFMLFTLVTLVTLFTLSDFTFPRTGGQVTVRSYSQVRRSGDAVGCNSQVIQSGVAVR